MQVQQLYQRSAMAEFVGGHGLVTTQRAEIVAQASGVVFEVGIGSGLNLNLYDPAKVSKVIALGYGADSGRVQQRMDTAPIPVELLSSAGDELALRDASVDTVLFTYALCSVPDVETALDNVRRVLKPTGRMLFCEHGRSPDEPIARWQDRLNPAWMKLSCGCNLNRDVRSLIHAAGYVVRSIRSNYVKPFPKVVGFTSWGVAQPRGA